MRRIESIIKISEQGISRPFLCKDEDGGIRWCKGSHTGFRSLVSEWICANLARAVNLPVPDFAIFQLDCRDFCDWSHVQNYAVPNLVTDSNKYVFGSLNVENSKDVFDAKAELSHIDQKELAKIYWFDELIHNTDRTDVNSNLLVNGCVSIIDHNNAFDPFFDAEAFAGEHILRHWKNAISTEELQAFKASVRDLVQGSFIDRAWNEMPDEWADAVEAMLSLDEICHVILEGCNA